jgi:XTP/dITP diphosphohydrolase
MDDVPTGQPALALAQKVVERTSAAGLPADLIPDTITSVTVAVGSDSENGLRSATLEFMDTVRGVEHAIAAGRRGEDVPEELDVATLGEITEEEWRAYWPSADTEPSPEDVAIEDVEEAEEVEEAEPVEEADESDTAAEKFTA